jgi:hypothetical protein
MEGSPFPISTAQDDEQVMTALDTASALWSRGDAREALRWLRRAAEAAGEAGDDFRAVQLARAAADLSSELQIPPSLVPASMNPLGPRSQPSHPVPAPHTSYSPQSYPPAASLLRSQPPLGRAPAPSAALRGRSHQALHVAVIPSPEDGNLLYVRVLGEGEALPPGSQGALLVALDGNANLLSRRA